MNLRRAAGGRLRTFCTASRRRSTTSWGLRRYTICNRLNFSARRAGGPGFVFGDFATGALLRRPSPERFAIAPALCYDVTNTAEER